MREIKFRAWKKRDSLGEFGYKKGIYTNSDIQDDRNYWLNEEHFGSDFILMQYTGLKDKNGKEIYEGDVVYLAGYGEYVVEFPFIQLYESSFEKDIGEIIGNIYENPELLNPNQE